MNVVRSIAHAAAALAILGVLSPVQSLVGQEIRIGRPVPCAEAKAILHGCAQDAGSDPLIVIARLGKGESSQRLNSQRLRSIHDFLVKLQTPPLIPSDRLVLAQGERVSGLGRIEVYVKGKLQSVLPQERGKSYDFLGCE